MRILAILAIILYAVVSANAQVLGNTETNVTPERAVEIAASDTEDRLREAAPSEFPKGVSIPATNGTFYALAPIADGAPALAVYDHASPRDGKLGKRTAAALASWGDVQLRLFQSIRASSNIVREARQRIPIIRQTVTTNGVASAADRARWLAVQSNLVEIADLERRNARNDWFAFGAMYDLTWGTNAPSRLEGEP